MPKKFTPIKSCRSCKSKKLISILNLGNFYLSEFRKDNEKPKIFPLNLVLCTNCLLLQLRETTPSKYLYTKNYGYKSGINNTMKKELKEITKKSLKKLGKKKITALDIGANDGTLLGFFSEDVKKIAVEPIKKFAEESKKNSDIVINDFFNFESYQKRLGNKKVDLITAISCFYDIADPNKFLSDILKILRNTGIIVIQQNYVVKMLEKNAFDNIVHEHLEYYSLCSLVNLLTRHNLEVFDVELSDINGGSFRTYIALKGTRKISKSVKKLESLEKSLKLQNKKIYLDFAKRIKKNKEKLLNFLKKEIKKKKNIYLYGASTRGNTLIQYLKLDNKFIRYAVERNPEKWGKKIASLGIPIISEEEARKNHPDYMIVLPWFFKEEFLEREKKYLESGGHFIFPLPKMLIV